MALREDHKLRIFENCSAEENIWLKGRKSEIRLDKYYTTKSCTISFRKNDSDNQGWTDDATRKGGRKICSGVWLGNLKEEYHFEYLRLDGKITLRWLLKQWIG